MIHDGAVASDNSPTPLDGDDGGPAAASSFSSWWRRNTDVKGLSVTVIGLVVTLAGVGLAAWAWMAVREPSRSETVGGGRTAGVGAQVLPERVSTGPRDFRSRQGERMFIPERRDVYGVPRISDSPRRRWCQDEWCQYDFPFVGASYLSANPQYRRTETMYVAQVFPEPVENIGTTTASSFSDSGEGDIVVDVPFKNGWVCFRMTVAFGSGPDAEPVARTPWSTAACFLLDDQGYVIRGENRV